MRMAADEAVRRFAAARVARLATVDAAGRPHLVPLVFALVDGVVHSAVDAKPKRSAALRRLANIAAQPHVSLLVDHYADDWSTLWWVRADGCAELLPVGGPDERRALRALTARYPQYAAQPPPGPVIAVRVRRWSGWQAAPGG
jgi:PPOX class probable F420-dependent enzyme